MEKRRESLFLNWSDAFHAGSAISGGKGWNLGRLDRYGFKVPMGGVLTTESYKSFIEVNELRKAIEDCANSITVENVNEQESEQKLALLRERIIAGFLPIDIRGDLVSRLQESGILNKPVAVRSSASAEDSAGASFAGIHDSFLNVLGIDRILTAIKGCYASLWTPTAVSYRRKMNIRDNDVMPAVVIMEMAEAKAAGIGFTCDPRSGRQDVLIINANFGLGECVVKGVVEPDEYHLDLDPCFVLPQIIKKRIGRKEGITIPTPNGGTEFIDAPELASQHVLSDENIQCLGLLLLRVYDSLGCGEQHQDIEWVFDGREFLLVQARPVTVLPRYTYPEIKNQPDIWFNSGYRESNPMVQSTLNWRLAKHSLDILINSMYQAVGYPLIAGIQFNRLFHGRVYGNLTVAHWIGFDAFGTSPADQNIMFGHMDEIQIDHRHPYRGIKGLQRIRRLLRFLFTVYRFKRNANKFFEVTGQKVISWRQKGFAGLDDQGILDTYTDLAGMNQDASRMFSAHMMSAVVPIIMLVKELGKSFPGKGNAIANAIMAGSAEITSAEHGYRIMELAETARVDADALRFFSAGTFHPLAWEHELPDDSPFKQSFQSFLAKFGHRGVYELDIINPRWREDPSYLLDTIRTMINSADLGKVKARQKETCEGAWRQINRKLPFYKRPIIKYWAKQVRKSSELREMSKSMLVKIFEPFRMMALEIGRRFAAKGIIDVPVDIFHCSWFEVFSILRREWNGKGLDKLVAERKVTREKYETLAPPDFYIEEEQNFIKEKQGFAEPIANAKDRAFTGLGVAAGKAEGTARLVYHPGEGSKLQVGDVLVASSTDPAWTPLFLKVSAVIMETGGYLSHGSIVAREYGIPAVVNIPGVMRIIEDGQKVTVDGNEGKVYFENLIK